MEKDFATLVLNISSTQKFGTCEGDILKSKQQTIRFFVFFFFEKELELKFDSTE